VSVRSVQRWRQAWDEGGLSALWQPDHVRTGPLIVTRLRHQHDQGSPLLDQLSSISAPASIADIPGCDCYVHRFGSIAPARRARLLSQ
jgi:hypothetical protein